MTDDEKTVAAVYVGWGTFKNSLDQVAQGVPNLIDKSVFQGQSWGVKAQLVTGFKFLGLADDDGRPTAVLTAYAAPDLDEEERKKKLREIFRNRYSKLFELDLMKATPSQIEAAMSANYGVNGDTREKAIRFFFGAMVYLGIPFSKHLRPRGSSNGGVRKKGKARKKEPPVVLAAPPPISSGGTAKSITLKRGETLTLSATADFFGMDSADRKFVFELIDKLEEYERASPVLPFGPSQTNEKGGEGDEVRPTVKD
jgi:hypothetical protein